MYQYNSVFSPSFRSLTNSSRSTVMQAFLSTPAVFPSSSSWTHVIKRESLTHSRSFYSVRCQSRAVVFSRTTDELRPTDDVKSRGSSFSSSSKPFNSDHDSLPLPHDNEDSELAVDAALNDLNFDGENPNVDEKTSYVPKELPELRKPAPRPSPARPHNRYGDQTESRMGRQGNDISPPPKFEADPDASYYSRCGRCTAVYEIDPQVLGRGRKVSCAVCSNVWFQKPDRLSILDKGKEKFIDYPMDQKNELMADAGKERGSRPRVGERRENRSHDDRHDNGDRDFRGRRTPGRTRSQYSVFIGNLSYEVTESDVQEILPSKFRNSNVSVVKDHETGRSKGFAFCDVASEEEVNEVVSALNGSDLRGRSISARAGRKNAS